MKPFLDDNFLLETSTAERLYHEYAAPQPIVDYHCHLSPDAIAKNQKFASLTQIWLGGDHYKWRAMRSNGVPERYCTGNASDWEKFEMWAHTVPYTLCNPLYHWTHMELKRPFGIENKRLDPATAREIYDHCNAQLAQDAFSTQGLLRDTGFVLARRTVGQVYPVLRASKRWLAGWAARWGFRTPAWGFPRAESAATALGAAPSWARP